VTLVAAGNLGNPSKTRASPNDGTPVASTDRTPVAATQRRSTSSRSTRASQQGFRVAAQKFMRGVDLESGVRRERRVSRSGSLIVVAARRPAVQVDNRFLMRPRIWLSFAGKA
jgi:hypothetical protein